MTSVAGVQTYMSGTRKAGPFQCANNIYNIVNELLNVAM